MLILIIINILTILMHSKISAILEEIERKKKELVKEYGDLKKKYGYYFQKRKIVFLPPFKLKNKKLKKGIWAYVFGAKVRHVISLPFIYAMFFPTIFLDLFLFIYQNTCFRLYGIPIVKRKDYLIYDKRFLDYLNIIQKFHCIYCSYVNGIFSYAVEIGGRTERYWCPIKSAYKWKGSHEWESKFADYGDAEGFKEVYNNTKCFRKK